MNTPVNTRLLDAEVRDEYSIEGVMLMHSVTLPRNPFKPAYEICVVDLCLDMRYLKMVLKFVGELSEDYYTEDGIYTPIFRGDASLERATAFIKEYKNSNRKENTIANR